MTVRVDPEENELKALVGLVDLAGKHVLEIGSGDGRLTWRYAGRAGHVTGIELYAPSVERAMKNIPPELINRVEFRNLGFEEFAASASSDSYDMALFSWAI